MKFLLKMFIAFTSLFLVLPMVSMALTLSHDGAAHRFANQTSQLSPILPGATLPFRIVVEKADFELPVGIHSGVVGVHRGLWVLIAGSMNGLHGFGGNPFPADAQNSTIYVIDPKSGRYSARSLRDSSAGLTQQQIDNLSVSNPQGYQDGDTLYMSGGYGIDSNTGLFGTKAVLTAIYLPGIIQWVTQQGEPSHSVIKHIRELYHPIFQVTGGEMVKLGPLTQIIFGQNFNGVYSPSSNGDYIQQVRRFVIKDEQGRLAVDIYPSLPSVPDPSYRRRDLNVLPVLLQQNNELHYGHVAYAGVFTLTEGVFTVPVIISQMNAPVMPDPNLPATFKQGMNHYVTATASLYSKKEMNNYNLFFGGISYGFYSNGTFQTDSEIPFINQITTIKMDKNTNFTQYLMESEYPLILSTEANPGNALLFGAGAYFIANPVLKYPNGVISLDAIRKPTVIGYIVGGIQSTLPNTTSEGDSAASPYVFKVTLVPNNA